MNDKLIKLNAIYKRCGNWNKANIRDIINYIKKKYNNDSIRINIILQLFRNQINVDENLSDNAINFIYRIIKEDQIKDIEIKDNVKFVWFKINDNNYDWIVGIFEKKNTKQWYWLKENILVKRFLDYNFKIINE